MATLSYTIICGNFVTAKRNSAPTTPNNGRQNAKADFTEQPEIKLQRNES